ncbi:MAG: sugar phosphate isomerase/epimerase [Bacteroidota bacterium]
MKTKNNRRRFLQQSAAIATTLPLLSAKNIHTMLAASPYYKEIGLQLYTVRNQLSEDFEGTLRAIKEAGYFQIEGGDTIQVKKALPITKDLGLAIRSSFFQWSFVTERWDLAKTVGIEKPEGYTIEKVIDEAAESGLSYLIFGYMLPQERSTLDDYRKVADKANAVGELCKKAGIKLCYHNHAFEFGKIDGTLPYDILIERFDNDLIRFELDVFWSSLAGYDPVKLMKKLKGRIRLLHLKDKLEGTPVIFDEQKVPEEAFKELGNGVVDLAKVIKLAEKIGVEQCMVEQDQSPDPIESIQTSIAYMKEV